MDKEQSANANNAPNPEEKAAESLILPGAETLDVAKDDNLAAMNGVDEQEEFFDEKQYNKEHKPVKPQPVAHAQTKRQHKPEQKQPKASKAWLAFAIVATCAIFAAGGTLIGMAIHKATTSDQNETSQAGQGVKDASGTLVENIAVIPETDDLALAFLKLHNDEENSCYSPLSIRYALSMLAEGAGGETRAQIEKLLHGLGPKKYANIAEHLALANSLWVKNGLQGEIKDTFNSTLQSKFGASLHTDDFMSAENVNAWVKDNTLGLLDKALADEDVAGLTAMLVNVLAIDMEWQQQFGKDFTRGLGFGYADQDEGEENLDEWLRTTMRISTGGVRPDAPLYYNLTDNTTVLAMDLKQYGDTRLQFVAMMPENLPEFITNLDNKQVNNLLRGLRRATAANENYIYSFTAYIPKFEIDGGLPNLVSDLKTLGVTDAFDAEKADFSSMTNGKFFINSALHKTKFDFSEEGIKAAAITAFGGLGGSGGGHWIVSDMNIIVSINKPFLYLVRDVDSGDIWFAGTVYEPNLWKNDRAFYGYKK